MQTILIPNSRVTRGLAAGLLLALAGIAGAGDDPHRYVVNIDPLLKSMRVEARFARPVFRISARSRTAARFISDAVDCDSGTPLQARGRRLSLPDEGIRCLRYRVDLDAAAKLERRNATLSAANIVVSPAAWLWIPPTDNEQAITVHFDVDSSVMVSVPWLPLQTAPRTYSVLASPGSATAPATFGHFDYRETTVPGATLRVTLLRAKNDQPTDDSEIDALSEWIRSAAQNVSLAYGRFPNPNPSIVLIPASESRSGDSPVPFGRVIRDGGETIELYVDRDAPIDAFYDDWTATHEFAHLLLPYLDSRHRWISEGFAQYYQNLLLARAGQYSEQRAWQKLYEGLERGRKSAPELSLNRAADGERRSVTMKVYWGGAAIALLADVALRQRSNGSQSLDSVLESLQRCCLPAGRSWSGRELFSRLDALLDEPVFMPLYRQHAEAAGFPEVRPLLSQLGVDVTDDNTIRLNPSAPLAPIRRALTRR